MTTLDTINATLATVNSDERVATTYSASAHRTKDGVIVVESARITVDGDDDAESLAFAQQEASDRVAPQCAWCGASVPFDSPDGKAPAWLVLCCGADDCVAQREAEECEAEREHERASAR